MQLGLSLKEKIKKAVAPLTVMVASVLVGYYVTHAIFAAAPPAQGISINTDQAQYKAGGSVTITLSNTSSTNVFVKNNCPDVPLSVFRLQGNSWVSVHQFADISKCQGEPLSYMIPANHSIKTDYKYWPGLFDTPGTYKIVANIENYSQGPSTEFQITE